MEKSIGNVEHTLSPELVAELKRQDAVEREKAWKRFEENIPHNAKAVTAAFKSLYELYDDGLVKWMANLFDPDICVCNELYGRTKCEHHPLCGTAGFHYTHSARDTVGFLPVIEAMSNVFDMIESSGITGDKSAAEYFDGELGERIVSFSRSEEHTSELQSLG